MVVCLYRAWDLDFVVVEQFWQDMASAWLERDIGAVANLAKVVFKQLRMWSSEN
jgi:hypothetical protein